ncbi:mesoderm-specific transcript homolog protein-like [Liolophura sinensis]|uniref:mesoderm-specific transcript homolog protein-like n=1 Tax=Liolophura sinensis TaxID=3198878 RepID=UPI0031584343
MLVGFLVFKYLTHPPPDLSRELRTWMNSGEFYDFHGFKIFFIDRKGSGVGGTLVALHGFPTFSYDWTKILPGLEKQFSRVILIDCLGFGLSDKPTQHNYSIFEQADVIEGLLASLHVKDAHLISHDYGDTVAQEMVARFNERETKDGLGILSLCMLNGGVFTETSHPRPLQLLLLRPWLGPILAGLVPYHLYKHGFSEIFGPNTQPTSDEFWEFWTGIRYNRGERVLYRILQYIPERYANEERWVGALQSTVVPVHMIYGPADPVNPPEFVTHYRKVMPNPSISVLPGTIGHYPQWEAPGAVLKSYVKFITGLPKH